MPSKLFLPHACALCGCRASAAVCEDCLGRYWPSGAPRCGCCAISLSTPSDRCGDCLSSPPYFDDSIASADYAPPVDRIVLALKFGARLALARLFAERLHEAALARGGSLPQVLTAVPLGPKRLAERGFNQAVEIARPLAGRMNIPLEIGLAVRTRETPAQALLPPEQRRSNIRGAFDIPAAMTKHIQGRHIGIVDDVMTTGETLNELAFAFKRLGASRVTNLVFARTVK